MNRVCVFTLGCKVNQYESESIADALRERGCSVTDQLSVCDAYIINTCAVTREAERKSRQMITKIHKLNPDAPIYIVGCASQKDAQAFIGKKNVKVVCGTAGKREIVNLLGREGVFVGPPSGVYEDVLRTLRTRAFVKIQDGCDSFCSYCIIPYLRGRSRSRNPESIRREIASLSGSVKEFVFTGINISDYEGGLDKLIEQLSDLDVRIRLGSLEAGIAGRNLSSAQNWKKFCPHSTFPPSRGATGCKEHEPALYRRGILSSVESSAVFSRAARQPTSYAAFPPRAGGFIKTRGRGARVSDIHFQLLAQGGHGGKAQATGQGYREGREEEPAASSEARFISQNLRKVGSFDRV